MLDFDYELESEQYWAEVEYVLSWPFAYTSNWTRPMFEVLPS